VVAASGEKRSGLALEVARSRTVESNSLLSQIFAFQMPAQDFNSLRGQHHTEKSWKNRMPISPPAKWIKFSKQAS
jgi:hypothetical protein